MNAFTGGDKSDWKIEMSIPADINSKVTFIPAKNNVIETVQPVKIPQMLIPARRSNGWKGFAPKVTIIRL